MRGKGVGVLENRIVTDGKGVEGRLALITFVVFRSPCHGSIVIVVGGGVFPSNGCAIHFEIDGLF